jgi:hypothetical protein
MKCLKFLLQAAVGIVALAASPTIAQNLLVNPGFEDPITQDGPPFIGFWEGFSGGAGASAAQDGLMPRSGAGDVQLEILDVDNTFAGVFQDVVVVAGQQITYSGWNKTTSAPFGPGAEFRIEWRNAAGNNEVGRTLNFDPGLTTDYTPFTLTETVPAGADLARVVYAIQTFGGTTNSGEVFLDDFSITAIPEPTTLALAGLTGLVMLAAGRRRK